MSRASFPETFPPRREKNTVPLDLTLCEADQRSTDFPGKQALLACWKVQRTKKIKQFLTKGELKHHFTFHSMYMHSLS